MRTDKAYLIEYCGKKYILHLEFESSGNRRMGARMSAYNAVLHLEHDLPVISILIYLFKTKIVASPLVIEGYDGLITIFHFRVLPLFLARAKDYVDQHVTCMYPFVPIMKGATYRLLKSVMKELTEVYKDDTETLSDFFAYMVILLERVKTIAPLEKTKMKEVLNMYNNLWDQSPIVQRMKAASKEEGKAEGLRKALINVVCIRFPHLTDLARERAGKITDVEALNKLHEEIVAAPDEASIRMLLVPTVA